MKGTKALMLILTLLAGAALAAGPASTKPARVPISDQDVVRSEQVEDKVAPKPDDGKTAPVRPAGDAGKTDEVRPSQTGARTATVQAPAPPKPPRTGAIETPAPKGQPGEAGGLDHPRRGGYGGRGPGGHRPPYGGSHWRGRHDRWPYRHYHGSWSFLWHHGPIIYRAPIYVPSVIRIPRHRVGVYVRQTGDDQVGKQFANAVREQLRAQGLRVVYSPGDARLELYVVSMDENPDEAGFWSAVSVSYIWKPGDKFITAQMLEVGGDQVDELAASVAGYADDLIDDYR